MEIKRIETNKIMRIRGTSKENNVDYSMFKKDTYGAKLLGLSEQPEEVTPSHVEEMTAEDIKAMKEVEQSLTPMEIKILNAMRNNEYNDALNEGGIHCTWVFTVIDNSGIEPNRARGVISSLVKKGLVTVTSGEDIEGIKYTELGVKLFGIADGQENKGWGGARLLKEKPIDLPEVKKGTPTKSGEMADFIKTLLEEDINGKKVKTQIFIGEGWKYERITHNNAFKSAQLTINDEIVKLKVPSKKNAEVEISKFLGKDIKLK